ncbi:hypothetical protein M433DRAFT_289450 [Acidomyces richmondensis BFW]|nr:MAG: hypothetical protein FE78DRAFT_473173 [Acidomyces sp. 'richmondensis']KYG44723.1 hypothetical protein M433DRAFT_289450 [Acidomyces richmondensis BFW]
MPLHAASFKLHITSAVRLNVSRTRCLFLILIVLLSSRMCQANTKAPPIQTFHSLQWKRRSLDVWLQVMGIQPSRMATLISEENHGPALAASTLRKGRTKLAAITKE